MVMRHSPLALFLGLALVSVCACGGGDPASTKVNCAIEDRDDTYVAGLEKPGAKGVLTVRLVESQPGPPLKGDNTWVVEVRTAAGELVNDAMITPVPFMPDHNHGTSIKPKVTFQGAGRYQIAPLNLFMSSLWRVQIDVKTPEGAMDGAAFFFCIEG